METFLAVCLPTRKRLRIRHAIIEIDFQSLVLFISVDCLMKLRLLPANYHRKALSSRKSLRVASKSCSGYGRQIAARLTNACLLISTSSAKKEIFVGVQFYYLDLHKSLIFSFISDAVARRTEEIELFYCDCRHYLLSVATAKWKSTSSFWCRRYGGNVFSFQRAEN